MANDGTIFEQKLAEARKLIGTKLGEDQLPQMLRQHAGEIVQNVLNIEMKQNGEYIDTVQIVLVNEQIQYYP